MEVTNMDTNACWSVEETWEDRDRNSDVVDEDDDVDYGDGDIDDDGDDDIDNIGDDDIDDIDNEGE